MEDLKNAVKKATGSSESEKEFSVQPIQEGHDPKTAAHKAHPGPVMTKDMPQQEGSKDERQARKEELNKD